MWPIEHGERAARERLSDQVYDYYAGGAGEEETLRANVAAWSAVRLRPRVLRDVSVVDTTTTSLGTPLRTPVAVAPTGFHRLAHPEGERATARGAAEAGSLCVLSTRSSLPMEEIRPPGPWWCQVYVLRDRDRTATLVTRAAELGAGALVLTADTPVLGRKRRAARDDVVTGADLVEQAADLSWQTVGWLRDLIGLPVVVKGVLRADDARAARDAGAAGVVVSNHGGRQLDGAVATAVALPEVVAAVGGELEIYVDGGIRRGVDALRALSLGARAVLLGRPVLWGLANDGAAGVHRVLTETTDDLAHAMALSGAAGIGELTPDLVHGSTGCAQAGP